MLRPVRTSAAAALRRAESVAAAGKARRSTSELAGTEEATGARSPSFGCGNPLAFAEVKPGETVVDLGSGPGFDLILAAKRVGPSGLVIGVDMTDAMIEEARRNAARAGFTNIEVRKGLIENLPVAAGSVDWVISNCVINLSPEKPRVFAEIARVLRPGGRFRISDIVVESLPEWIRGNAAAYAACVAGAIPEREYVAGLERAGLVDVKVESRLVYTAAQIRGLVDHDLKQLRSRARRDRGRIRRGCGESLERLLHRQQVLNRYGSANTHSTPPAGTWVVVPRMLSRAR